MRAASTPRFVRPAATASIPMARTCTRNDARDSERRAIATKAKVIATAGSMTRAR
jgi:hypothetical protein